VPDLDLLESEDLAEWTSIDGNFAEGFTMEIDPANEYEYLDIEDPTVAYAFTDGYHEFFVDNAPAGYLDYWDSRGVNESATGWQAIMWEIINGDEPIFFLKVDGLDYMLVDGLQYALYKEDHPLRINGDYLPGLYTFSGSIANDYGDYTDLSVDILFNDVPFAEDQSVETVQDQAVDITLTAINGYGTLEWHLINLPLNGNITGTGPNLTYTPDPGFNGLDSFTFYVMDELGATSNTATVSIKILGIDCLSIDPTAFNHQQAPDTIQTLNLSITNSCQSEADFSLIQATVFVEEGFEEGIMPPSGGWETFHRGTTTQVWRVDSNPMIVYEGVYAATIYFDDFEDQDEWLVTPLLEKTGLTDLVLSFMAESDTNWPGATVKVWVLDNTDTPLTSEPLWDLIRDEGWVDFDYHPVAVDLSAFDAIDQIRVAWQYVGIGGQSFNLDQIKLENATDVPWLALDPIAGTIPGESTQNVSLNFDTSGMDTGDYEALLYLRNPTQQPLPIPVILDVKHLNYFPLLLN
jgi:hypothetical protein